jgi:cyclic dehypoxanthinyl futalosine synthase
MNRRILIPVLVLGFIGLGMGFASATDRLVPSIYPTIGAAMDAANNGDRILVAAGTYPGPIEFLGKEVELISEQGAEVTFLDGNGILDSVVLMDSVGTGARLSGFTIQNGYGTTCGLPLALCGGAVLVIAGNPTIDNCIFTQNSASRGGGVHAEDSSLTIFDCIFLDNFDNIQASFVTQGADAASLALRMGCNDFGSAMLEENVVSAAGCHELVEIEDMERRIREAGRVDCNRPSYGGEQANLDGGSGVGPTATEAVSQIPALAAVQVR